MIRGVIIDLDDTLCLTEQACFELENDVLERMGRKPMSRRVHQANWGKPVFEAINERSPGIDVKEFRRIFAPVFEEYVKCGKLDKIEAENHKALDALIKKGKELVVLTSRTHTELRHMLDKAHALSKRISVFYYHDNMEFHKPDPKAFSHIEREHGWKPNECVYIGDSISDAQSANGAGLHFIVSLESGLRAREDFSNYRVDAFINDFPEVIDAIRDLDKRLEA